MVYSKPLEPVLNSYTIRTKAIDVLYADDLTKKNVINNISLMLKAKVRTIKNSHIKIMHLERNEIYRTNRDIASMEEKIALVYRSIDYIKRYTNCKKKGEYQLSIFETKEKGAICILMKWIENKILVIDNVIVSLKLDIQDKVNEIQDLYICVNKHLKEMETGINMICYSMKL